VDHRDEKFLRITFDGGRFSDHTVPVGVLAELSTFQKLIFTVARSLFLKEETSRDRIPRGFADGSQLFLATTEDNCFTAAIVRRPGAEDFDWYFKMARDMTIGALAASDQTAPDLLDAFPRDAHKLLAQVGRKLADDESLVVRNGTGPTAKVTRESRARLATLVRVALETEESVDGEVEKVDDGPSTFTLRRKGDKLEVPFTRAQREIVTEALKGRPLVGLRFHGLIVSRSGGRRVGSVDDLEPFEHPRAHEVKKLWGRLDDLMRLEDGWIEGEGVAPAEKAVVSARDVLGRLLVDHEWVDRPKVFPTPSGGIQAEWMLGPWACEVVFSPDGSIRAEATQTEDDRDSEIELDRVTPSNADQLEEWLAQLAARDGEQDRV